MAPPDTSPVAPARAWTAVAHGRHTLPLLEGCPIAVLPAADASGKGARAPATHCGPYRVTHLGEDVYELARGHFRAHGFAPVGFVDGRAPPDEEGYFIATARLPQRLPQHATRPRNVLILDASAAPDTPEVARARRPSPEETAARPAPPRPGPGETAARPQPPRPSPEEAAARPQPPRPSPGETAARPAPPRPSPEEASARPAPPRPSKLSRLLGCPRPAAPPAPPPLNAEEFALAGVTVREKLLPPGHRVEAALYADPLLVAYTRDDAADTWVSVADLRAAVCAWSWPAEETFVKWCRVVVLACGPAGSAQRGLPPDLRVCIGTRDGRRPSSVNGRPAQRIL